MNCKLKLFLSILFISTLILSLFIYFQINKFNKPYEIVEHLIVDAEKDKEFSSFILSNNDQNEYIWDYFKGIINKREFNYYSYTYKEIYSLKYKILNANRTQVVVDMYFYDEMGLEIERKRILLEKVDNSWKVRGVI